MKKFLLAFALLLSSPAFAVDYTPGSVPGGFPGHSLIGIQVFTSGTPTYTPDAGTNQVIIEVVAAGGGSGSCAITDSAHGCVGGSGASGSYAKGWFTSGFSGITMTVGSAGTAGNVSAGGTGGTTSAGSLISCPGGTGGVVGVLSTAASFAEIVGGVAAPSVCTQTGGTVIANVQGQPGGPGFQSGLTQGTQYPGTAGSTPLGFGMGSFTVLGSLATSPGAAGTGYGWGAGGSLQDASQAAATVGLAGGPARIIVYEFN